MIYRLKLDDVAVGLAAGIVGFVVLLLLAAATGGEGDGRLLILWIFPGFVLVGDCAQTAAYHGVGLTQLVGGVATTIAPLLALVQWFCYAVILRHQARSGRSITTLAVLLVVHLGLGLLASLLEQ